MTADQTRLLNERLRTARPLGEAALLELQLQTRRLGFGELQVRLPLWAEGSFQLSRDPADGSVALVGRWTVPRRGKVGEIVVHADGQVYAEHDVALPHPGEPKWFVEAVTVWGTAGKLKGEARLLPLPQ